MSVQRFVLSRQKELIRVVGCVAKYLECSSSLPIPRSFRCSHHLTSHNIHYLLRLGFQRLKYFSLELFGFGCMTHE